MFKYESPTMSKAIKELKAPTINKPPEPSENAGVAFEKWKVVYNKLNKEKEAYEKITRYSSTCVYSITPPRWR